MTWRKSRQQQNKFIGRVAQRKFKTKPKTIVLSFYPHKSCFRILISIKNLNQYSDNECL